MIQAAGNTVNLKNGASATYRSRSSGQWMRVRDEGVGAMKGDLRSDGFSYFVSVRIPPPFCNGLRERHH